MQMTGGGGVGSIIDSAYSGSLRRYADASRQALDKLSQAESGYGAMIPSYAPGGSYGAGQKSIVRQNAAGALSQYQVGAIGAGMSSSTNAAGMAARIKRDATQAELGIEDTREDRYAAVVKGLADLRLSAGGIAGSLAANEPSYAPYVSTVANIYGMETGAATSRYAAGLNAQTQMQTTNIAAQTQRDIQAMRSSGDSSGLVEDDWL
jgi:hypothetical protein